MTRDKIEKAAGKFHGSVGFWSNKVAIEFAIQIHNKALEEAAKETTNFRVRDAIRALKIGEK